MSMQQSYYPGDKPAEVLEVTPLLDLSLYSTATGQAVRPDGTTAGPVAAAIDLDSIELSLAGIELDQPGVWQLRITVANADASAVRRLAPVLIVVQDETTGWHTLETARSEDWVDARDMSDITLWQLLETAKGDVLEFAPVLAEGAPIPTRYRAAQLMQARNRWNASMANPSTGDGGLEGFTLTVFPLDWQVKQLLRPSRGVPAHG